jgi:hypothetical protein
MKKIIFALIFTVGFTAIYAQTDSLQEYTGKFKFPEGSPVSEIGVVIENGVLTATSAMGNSELKKTDTKDVYEIVAYSGTATFKRNAEGKITTLLIQVQDITMEGTKSEGVLINRNCYFPESRK